MSTAQAYLRLRQRQRGAGVVFVLLVVAAIAGALSGCFGAPQHPVPGFTHPAIEIRERVDEFQEGIALEKAHKRTIDDDFQLRGNVAADKARKAARYTKQDFVLLGRELGKLASTARSRVTGWFGY